MSRTFTYTFANGLGSISVVTPDNAQSVVADANNNRSYTGYAITSVSGRFNGQTVMGLFGNSGSYQDSGNSDYHNNTIFVNSSQGLANSSYDGIDNDGIDFILDNGNHVNLYQVGVGQSGLAYQVYDASQNFVGNQGAATVTETNYASTTCFTTGTLIRTTRGAVAVEALRVGDHAVTASGALRPITWIGHRALGGNGERLPHDQQPIRVRAGAFGPGLPERDLRLSPGHPVLVGADANNEGGVLVPVMCLINGTSIAREPASAVTYWHVELDAHDILLAEGLPAESYLDWGDRPFFTEGSDHALHNPDFVVPGLGARCRPVAVDGPVVEAERARLAAVFAAELASHSAWSETDGDDWLAA